MICQNICILIGLTFVPDNIRLLNILSGFVGHYWAHSNFRAVTVWGTGLWQELLRGRESIRQGLLQSGHLLKMQLHHLSLSQTRTCVCLTASFFFSQPLSSLEFFQLLPSVLFLTYLTLLSFTSLFLLYLPFSLSTLHVLSKMAGVSRPQPRLCEHWPKKAFSLLLYIARHWSAFATVLGQE